MTTEGGGMKPSRDEIAAAIRAADIGGYGSTVDHEEAAENVLALLSQAGGSEAMKARCKKAVAFWRGEVERLQAENERLRQRLDEIITAATSGAGSAAVYAAIDRAARSGSKEDAHIMTTQTNHLKLGPWQPDPGIQLFAPEPFEQTDRMLSLDRKVWQEFGSPDALIVTIEVPS